MFFLYEYLQNNWNSLNDARAKKNWDDTWDAQERDRQRDRILAWRDRVATDDFAVNAEESEFYRRTAGFVWRHRDPSGHHKARNHQYLYNLAVWGHKTYSRRDKGELEAARAAVAAQAASGELGPLSPLN